MNEKDLISSEAETATSIYGVLAGLTFTASILIFSIRNSLPWGGLFLTFSLVSTVLFIYSATLTSNAAGCVSDNRIQDARTCLRLADNFGALAFIMLLADISLLAFYTGWEYGVIVSITVILCFLYIVKKYLNKIR